MYNYDNNVLDKIDEVAESFLRDYEQKCSTMIFYGVKDEVKAKQLKSKIAHIRRTVALTDEITNGNKLAILAAKLHDIGRFPQYELLGGFKDGLILHHNLGEDIISRMLFSRVLEPSVELDIIRQSIMYHGRMQFIPFQKNPITREAMEITEIVSEVDDLDNGCIGVLGYIEGEILNDSKDYKKNNPDLDMKSISPRVFEFFSKGQKFNKMTECHTYADYLLFAAVLAIQSLKGKHRELAAKLMKSPCFGYKNAMEGYRELFRKYLDPKLALEAYDIFYGFYVEAKGYEPNTSKQHI